MNPHIDVDFRVARLGKVLGFGSRLLNGIAVVGRLDPIPMQLRIQNFGYLKAHVGDTLQLRIFSPDPVKVTSFGRDEGGHFVVRGGSLHGQQFDLVRLVPRHEDTRPLHQMQWDR